MSGRVPQVFAGLAIRTLAGRGGLSYRHIAQRLSIHPSVIQNWANDRRPVPEARLTALAEALGCTVHDLADVDVAEGHAPVLRREDVPPLVYDWACVCIACGQRIYARWTDHEAELYMQSALVKCAKCRGAILIERADLGAIGTSKTGHSATYASLAIRYGKTA